MKRRLFSRAVFLLLITDMHSLVAGNREYPCYRFTGAPVLDGMLDNDPAWKNIPATTGFLKLDKKLLVASKQTSLKIGYTDNDLYMGIRCEEPEIGKVKAEAKDMGALWTDDSVEVFICLKGSGDYIQLVINSIGSRYNRSYAKRSISLDDWEAAAHRGAQHYSIEIRLPFEIFGGSPDDSEIWTGNVSRNINTSGDQLSSWAHLEKAFHERANFGSFIFKGRSIIPEQVRAIEVTLAARYAFKQEIQRLLKPLSSVQLEWSKFPRDRSLRKEASRILKEYRRIKGRLSSFDAVRPEDIPELLERSKACISKAYDLETKLLLEKLFQE